MKPLVPVSPAAKVALGVAFFGVFFAAWAVATMGGFVSPTFLADPLAMLGAGWRLLVVHGFYRDIGVTIWRVFGGVPPGGADRRAARHPHGRLQADRGVLRAVRVLRAL